MIQFTYERVFIMKLRKSLFIPIILLVVTSCLITAFAGEGNESVGSYTKFYRGDMNEDQEYSLRDALSILKVAAKVEAETDKADMNLDGVVTVDDAKQMFELALNKTGTYGFYTYREPAEDNVILVDYLAYPNGNSVFHSLQDAVEYVNANAPADENGRITILMAPGIYREQVTVTAPYITIKPMDPNAGEVKITHFYGFGNFYNALSAQVTATNSAPFMIDKSASCFEAYDIVFENSYNIYLVEEELTACRKNSYDRINERFTANDATINQAQALAVRCAGDKAVFKNCSFYGRQDTLMFPKGGARAYLENCYIEGTVDFIYADGTCVFNKCTINSPYGGGYITAACTPADEDLGFLFYDCTITRDAKNGKEAAADGSYSLGRPWGQEAMVVYWNCKMDSHIKTGYGRWENMGDATAEAARFFEVGSMDINGNPLDLESVVDTARGGILTQEDMMVDGEYAAWKWLWGEDQWNPADFEVPEA